MTIPLQITFRDLPSSAAVETQIRERAEHLEHLFGRVTSCRVVVEGRHRPQRAGKVFNLRVELAMPGRVVAVGNGPAALRGHDDVFVAVRAAFEAARRQLSQRAARRRAGVRGNGETLPIE
ncbi:MAG: ribosome-associated translation inhibitor RaiA [Alphaproteobacteria bacterium]|nr:ribosome-associated translation inhibitor RaiA [Alphaproteobacteria bacterium]